MKSYRAPPWNNMRRVLVTGGAGFVGSFIDEALIGLGYDVVCADNFYTGRKANIVHLLGNPHFELLRHDITFPLYVEVDEIFNLACAASPVHYQSRPVQTMKTSVHGVINMLGLAKRVKAKILQASTSEVYGNPEIHPQKEDNPGKVNFLGKRACYTEGKRSAETLFMDYHRTHGLRIKIVRIFNTYGPRMDPSDGRVVSNFIMQALRNEDITVYGDGSQTRSLCYVTDLVGGIIKMMETDDKCTGPINLGNPTEITMLELATLIKNMTGSRSKIMHIPLPQDDPIRRRPDISKAKEYLGWEPVVPLEDGLRKTIDYFEHVMRSPMRHDAACID